MMSCNAYFCYVLKNVLDNKRYANSGEAFDKWHDYVESFGFGHSLGSDVPYELGGTIPHPPFMTGSTARVPGRLPT